MNEPIEPTDLRDQAKTIIAINDAMRIIKAFQSRDVSLLQAALNQSAEEGHDVLYLIMAMSTISSSLIITLAAMSGQSFDQVLKLIEETEI